MRIKVERYEPSVFECSNSQCPNVSSLGAFSRVQIGEGKIVGGHRSFILYLCAPCADALNAEVVPNE